MFDLRQILVKLTTEAACRNPILLTAAAVYLARAAARPYPIANAAARPSPTQKTAAAMATATRSRRSHLTAAVTAAKTTSRTPAVMRVVATATRAKAAEITIRLCPRRGALTLIQPQRVRAARRRLYTMGVGSR